MLLDKQKNNLIEETKNMLLEILNKTLSEKE